MEWYWIVAIVFGAVVLLLIVSSMFYKQFCKRFYDMVLSGLAIIILSPVLIILTIIGAIAMHGNPFFVQFRPGKIDSKTGKERIFKLVKFRTMSNAKDRYGFLLSDEKRLTNYGSFLRKTSLDELPELINILLGNMAIIGPRPLLVEYLPFYSETERHRHDVRPGLTGWAQVNGRNSIDWEKRFEFDVEYVNSISIMFDIKIMFMTVMKVIAHSGIYENTQTSEGNFAIIRKAQIEEANK